MAQITPNLQLTVWNNLSDPYDSGQLADNFVKIDLHDHSGGGKGIKIDGTKSILPNTISSVQIGGGAVGSTELKSDPNTPGDNNSRAVGTEHIKNLAVTGDKIANGAITRSKLSKTSILGVPFIPHANVDGSLPSNTVDGEPLYDGYVIDYGLYIIANNDTGHSGSGSPQITTTSSNYNYVWRLRYNGATQKWDYIGGTPYQNGYIGDLSYNDIPEQAMYVGWDSQRFQNLTIPLKGYYRITSTGSIDITVGANAVFQTALYKGAAQPSTNISSSLISNTSAFSYVLGSESGASNDQISSVTTDAVVNITSNTDSNNVLKQAFGLSHKSAPSTTDAILRSQRWVVTPFKNLTNF